MSKRFPLTSGYQVIPEGTHAFKITAVEYDDQFGIIKVNLTSTTGLKHQEKFYVEDKDGNPNEGACIAFSMLARAAMDNNDLEDIDPEELVGKWFECEVEHDTRPSNRDPSKTVTFVKLTDRRPYNSGETTKKTSTPDLAELLADV